MKLIKVGLMSLSCVLTAAAAFAGKSAGRSDETAERVSIAAASLEDAVVIDCQLPGKLQKLGGTRTYLTPGRLMRLSAVECRTRGGEYTLGDLSSGTLSLKRWLPLAEKGDAEAQYYVARIHANGMSGVPVDYTAAADWYGRAAKQSYLSAQQELGYLYEQGLGVKQDLLLALDLQRKASGLGDELDYAWKISAAKETAAQQIAQLTDRLEDSNTELETLRTQLGQTRDSLAESRARLARSESAVLDLRANVEAAKQAGSGADVARIKELQGTLASREAELRASQSQIGRLEVDLAARQSQLSASLTKSQAASLELNELLASGKDETKSLRGQLAQAQLRLIDSQRELGDLRAQYKRDVDKLSAERSQLAALRAKPPTPGNSPDVQRLTEQLATRNAELTHKQRRLASLEADAGMLRDQVQQLRDERSKSSADQMGEAQRLRERLTQAQAKIANQREQLDEAETEWAGERAKLIQAQDRLQQQMQTGQARSQREILVLQGDIKQREQTIKAKEEYIAVLKQQLSTDEAPVMLASLTTRSPKPKAVPDFEASKLLAMAQGSDEVRTGRFFALVIGNNNYTAINGLSTPLNDARSVAELFEQRYGFKVKLLADATAADIMMSLHSYTRTLTEGDSLLIYYAGHGDIDAGNPGQAAWLGVDADPETRTGYLATEQIRAKVKQMKARHVLLVADSCFSGAITHPTTTTVGRGMNERRFRILWDRRARVVLTSGQMTPVVDSAGDRNHSLFAKYFLQILRQNNFVMSGEMLSHELSERMQPAAAKLNLTQTPTYSTLQDADHQLGDFFFVPVPAQLAAVN